MTRMQTIFTRVAALLILLALIATFSVGCDSSPTVINHYYTNEVEYNVTSGEGLATGLISWEITGESVRISQYLGGGSVIIPSSIDGKPVTAIGDNVFNGNDVITSVTVPSGVTNIGDYCFYSCDALTNVTLPTTLVSVGDSSFYHCARLTSLSRPASVTSVGTNAFTMCGALLSSVTVNGVGASVVSNATNYEFEIPATNSVTIAATAMGDATVSGTGTFSFTGTQTFTLTVTSGDGVKTRTYLLTVMGNANPVTTFEDQAGGALKVNNLSEHDFVLFKGTITAQTLIQGVRGNQETTIYPVAAGQSDEFVLRGVAYQEYTNKDLSDCKEIFSAFVYVDTEVQRQLDIDASLGGDGVVTLYNQTAYNVELRNGSWVGTTVAYLTAQEQNKTAYLETGSYYLYPVFKYMDSQKKVRVFMPKSLSNVITRYVSADPTTITVENTDVDVNLHAAGYVEIYNAYNNGLEFLNGTQRLLSSTGVPLVNPGKRFQYEIEGRVGAGTAYSTLKIKKGAGTAESVDAIAITNGIVYELTVAADGTIEWTGATNAPALE